MTYRRTVVVDTETVLRNAEAIRAVRDGQQLAVSTSRSSNVRFLVDGADLLRDAGIDVVDGDLSGQNEIAVHELLGSHPETETGVSLESHVFGLRDVAAGDGVSYGATYVAPTDRVVALAPIGFADGLDRKLSGSLRVRVNGIDSPVVGRIAMDSISIDVTAVGGVAVGDTVVVYGNTTDEGWGVRDSAEVLRISVAELICRLSERAEVEWR
ncbi:MAG: alanine racemase [Actinomycetota bacterium]